MSFCLLLILSCSGGSDGDPEPLPQMHTGDLRLENQEDLEQFQADNITEVTGDLFIGTNIQGTTAPITDLSFLSNLVSVGGQIQIRQTRIETLAGLDNLESATELNLYLNHELVHLNNLGKLSATNLIISFHNKLSSLEGLAAMEADLGKVQINGNHELTDLSGLGFLGTVSELAVAFNAELTSLNGLNNLAEVDEYFILWGNDNLPDLSGLSSLTTITGQFTVEGNDRIISLEGAQQLSNVGLLNVLGNPLLEDLSGLEGIEETLILNIRNNERLESLKGLENLNSGLTLKIRENNRLTDISALAGLTELSTIELDQNAMLRSLQGLHNIQSLNDISITKMASLTDLSGLSNLETVFEFRIKENPGLTSFNGLQGITSIGTLNVDNNPVLQEVSVFPTGLITTSLIFTRNPQLVFDAIPLRTNSGLLSLVLVGSPQVSSLGQLENLTTLDVLNISDMDGLENLDALANLTQVNALLINENELLANLDGLSGLRKSATTFELRSNPSLTDFCGLQGLINSDDFGGHFFTENNAFNPDLDAMREGNCKED